MHKRIENLLRLRDGEPIDAELKARLLNDTRAVEELKRLEKLKEAMRALPELAPPAASRARAVAAMGAAVGGRRIRARYWAASVAGIGLAAAIALVAPRLGEAPGWVAALFDAGPEAPAETDYVALVQESVRLERLLAALPEQRRIMNVGTAGTIVGLENQIAYIDDQLTVAELTGMKPEYRRALWSERVDVMNALVQVRYAQSQAFWF